MAVLIVDVPQGWVLPAEGASCFPLTDKDWFEMLVQVVTSPLCTTVNLKRFEAILLSWVDLGYQSALVN